MISPLFAPCSLADNYAVSVLVFHGERLSFPLPFMACTCMQQDYPCLSSKELKKSYK